MIYRYLTNRKLGRWYYLFDGVDDYATVPELSFPTEFYWSFNIETSVSGPYQMLIADDYTHSYYLRLGDLPNSFSLWTEGRRVNFESIINLSNGEKHHIVLGYKESSWWGTVDGETVTVSGDIAAEPYTGANQLKIGSRNVLDRFFTGVISDVDLNGQYLDRIDKASNIENVNNERWFYV